MLSGGLIEKVGTVEAGGRITGDLVIEGDLTVEGSSTNLYDELVEGGLVVEATDTEALLIRKASDGGDVFTIDTSGETVRINSHDGSSKGLKLGATLVTSTASELNILDGASLSTTELNYVDGVTSAIQTQMDTKAPLASPTFTGTITIGSAGISEAELEILDGASLSTAELNLLDGVTATTAELNYLDVTTLGTVEASKAITVDASGNIDFNNGNMTNVDIDSGAIDGTNITVGSGKTLDVSGGTFTLASDQISGDKVNGGTISAFASTGIDDNASSNALTIDSSQNLALTSGTLTVYSEVNTGAGNRDIHLNPHGTGEVSVTATLDATAIKIASGTAMTSIKDEDNMASDSATSLSTQQSIKAYVDAVTTSLNAQDLDFQGDSGGALNIDLDTEVLDIAGDGAGITTAGSGNQITISGDHDSLTNFVANEHIDHSAVSISAGGILSGGGTIASNRTITLASSDVVHDSTTGFVANEHIDHSSVTLTAGDGLSGGGDLTSSRSFAVDLNELTTETTIADADFIAMVDATDSGSGKITFENLEDAIFSSVSGDVLITEAGVASIQANSVALTTDTTGNYVGTITGGTGIDSTAGTTGEGTTHTLSIDSTVTTLTGSQTLTNKTLTSPVLNTGVSGTAIKDEDTFASDSNTHLATQQSIKAYVDSVAQGLNVKTACAVATTANVTLSGEQTIDGVTTSTSRILVKDQSTASQNGIYVTASGSWARATDFDAPAEVASSFVFISGGTAGADTGWVCTNEPESVTVGTDSITFSQFSDAGHITAGTGLTKSGNSININASQSTITSASSLATVGALNSGSITSGFGTIDTGSSTANFGATTVDSLSVSDGNITNVGNIACDSISEEEGANGLIIQFGGATTTNIIDLSDSKANALNIKEDNAGSFLMFDTTNEKMIFGQALDINAVSDFGSNAMTNVNIDSGTINGITDLAVADGGTGASTFTDGGILLGSGTSAITATAVLGDGEILIGDGTTDPVALDIGSSTAITTLGTIGTGVWQGTAIASAYLDADTAHLSGAQTFTGVKSFSNNTFPQLIIKEVSGSPDVGLEFTSGGVGRGRIFFKDSGNLLVLQGTTYGGDSYTDDLVIDKDGNVGIGTSAPDKPLHVWDGNAGSHTVNGGTNVLIEGDSSTYLEFATPADQSQGILFADPAGVTGQITYSHGTDDMTITADDNILLTCEKVGIGTTAPDRKFHVEGTDEVARFTGTDANPPIIEFENSSGVQAKIGLKSGHDFIIDTAGEDIFMGSNANEFTILSGGNVGIGTSNPSQRLDILGNLTIDAGSITLEDTGETLTFTDSDVYINRASNNLILWTTGNVGIGHTSPTGKLCIQSKLNDTLGQRTESALNINTTGVLASHGAITIGKDTGNFSPVAIGFDTTDEAGDTKGDLIFATRNVTTDTQPTSRMRIAADGTSSFYGTVSIQANSSGDGQLTIDSTLTNDTMLTFYNENVMTWRLRSKGNVSDRFEFRDAGGDDGVLLSQGGTSWSSGSDERLKCNWTSFDDALSDINSLTKVGTFQYKNFGEDSPRNDKIHAGLSAQEVMKFLPSAVDAEEGEDSSEGFLSMRYQELIPVLVKAIQELSAKVETLENA
jgi:hypothetical protein